MKKVLLLICTMALASCASAAYQQSAKLSYPAKPADSLVLTQVDAMIRPTLKDPTSLKNLHITTSYKCYASKMEFTDNVSPKHTYGYWCYDFTYQATNSYGGYVTGTSFGVFANGHMQSVNALGETVRKHDDIYVYHSPNVR